MQQWKITFKGGAHRTVNAESYGAAKRKILFALGAHRLPPIISICLCEDKDAMRAKAIAAISEKIWAKSMSF